MKTVKIILLIIICVAAGYFLNGVLSQQKLPFFSSQATTPKQQVQQNVQSVVPQAVVKKIGDIFTLWDIQYQVLSASNFAPTYDFQKTTGKYVGIKIKVTNTGKTEAGLNKIFVQDSKGRQYQPSMLGYQQLGVEDYGMSNIGAGFTKTLGVIFEIPKDATGLELDYPSAQGPIVLSVKLGM
jgi:hypothetical protein